LKDFISNPDREIESGDDSITELVPIDGDIGSGETSQAWVIDRWNTNYDAAGSYEMIAHGPGSTATDKIYIGIQTYFNAGTGYYNWRMAGFTGYTHGDGIIPLFANQSGCTTGRWPRMLMQNQPSNYWFVANGRRIIVVVEISSVYECCYLGFGLPYGLPTQFPYPLVIGGSSPADSSHLFSSVFSEHRSFMNPSGPSVAGVCDSVTSDSGNSSTLKVLQGTSWINFCNRTGTTRYFVNNVWPFNSVVTEMVGVGWWWSKIKANIDNSFPLFPCVMVLSSPTNHIYGELQGCFALPGYTGAINVSPKDTIEIDGITYIIFPTVNNAARDDFWALKME